MTDAEIDQRIAGIERRLERDGKRGRGDPELLRLARALAAALRAERTLRLATQADLDALRREH